MAGVAASPAQLASLRRAVHRAVRCICIPTGLLRAPRAAAAAAACTIKLVCVGVAHIAAYESNLAMSLPADNGTESQVCASSRKKERAEREAVTIPAYVAFAVAHATHCCTKAVCVQHAHVLAWC